MNYEDRSFFLLEREPEVENSLFINYTIFLFLFFSQDLGCESRYS